MNSNNMETLSKIIVKKYFPSAENIKRPYLLTDKEYQIVKSCRLNDLLKAEANPAGLDRICEGEKLQTIQFYHQKEKSYKRSISKLYRKTGKTSAQPRTVLEAVSSIDSHRPIMHDNQTSAHGDKPSIHDIQPSAQVIATEGLMEPTRSNKTNEPQNDPYLMREEITPIPIVMPSAVLPEDENFGSNDVDGARDFLQLCTGEELPPMSMRQTMTRDMLLSQLPSIATAPPLVDNFQELDLKSINTPMFKRPLEASTPLVTSSVPEVQIPLPALEEFVQLPAQEVIMGQSEDRTVDAPPVEVLETVGTPSQAISTTVPTVPMTAQTGPSTECSEPVNTGISTRPLEVESSSSSDVSETPAPRIKRIRREVTFTEHLEPFEVTVSIPKPRRDFDIFSFPCHAIWNKTIQDVQNQLSVSYKELQSREVPVMREAAPEQKVDSGFQQTLYELSHRPRTMSVTDTSNLATVNQMNSKERNVLSNQLDTLMTPDMLTSMQPSELEALGSINGRLTEVSDRFDLNPLTEPTSASCEKPAAEQLAPVERVLQESSKINIVQPVVEADSRLDKKRKPGKRNKKMVDQDEHGPVTDVSTVLYHQAKELETISEGSEAVEEVLLLDAMVVDILLTIQGAMNNKEQLGNPIPMQRLRQLLRIDSRLGASKLFKNVILLRQADLLVLECDSEHRITYVSLKLQVNEPEI